jgi:hypothetical protein
MADALSELLADEEPAAAGLALDPSAPDALEELDAAENAPGVLESAGRGLWQGVTLNFSDELTGLVESAFTSKSYAQARDESRSANLAAQTANPWAYGAGEVAGGVALPGVGGAGLAAKVGLKGAKAAAGVAAVEGGLQGVGAAEEGDNIRSGLVGALTGGVLGGLGGKIAARYVDDAERRAVRNVTKDLTEGAIPTHQRRFAEIKELAFEEIEPDKAFMKAARGKPEEAAGVAQARLEDFGGQTAPIYKRLDETAGRVPVASVVSHLDEAIAKGAQDFADDGTAEVIQEVRDKFVATAKAKGNAEEVSHQDVRRWVTGLLKHKTRVMGSISETQSFELAAEAHRIADDFLKKHLDGLRSSRPELAGDLDKLSKLNRKIRAWASAEALMSHKEGRDFWKKDSTKLMTGVGGALGIAGIAAAGHPVGAAAALLPPALRGAAALGKGAERSATLALAKLSRAAREGNATKAMYLEAIKAGVPASAAIGAVGGMRNFRALLNDEPTEDPAE